MSELPNDLLLRIKSLINKHGGAIKLAEAIEDEWSRIPTLVRFKLRRAVYHFYNTYSDVEIFYIRSNHDKMPIGVIAKKMRRTYRSVQNKIYELKNSNSI